MVIQSELQELVSPIASSGLLAPMYQSLGDVRLWMKEKKGFSNAHRQENMHLLTIVVITSIMVTEMRDGLEEAP